MGVIYNYETLLQDLNKVNWKSQQVTGDDWKLNFNKAFLPESLAQVNQISFLNSKERLILNHIRSFEYVRICALAEDSLVIHLQRESIAENYAVRSLAIDLFITQELKHINLFLYFAQQIEQGLGVKCEFIGPTKQISRYVLSNHGPLAVAIMNDQFENMTKNHYTSSIIDDDGLDPLFKRLLYYHWLEESQHLKGGKLMIEAKVRQMTTEQLDSTFTEYLALSKFLETIIGQQAINNVENFMRVTGRTLIYSEREELMKAILEGMYWTYIGSVLTNPNFRSTLAVFPNSPTVQ